MASDYRYENRKFVVVGIVFAIVVVFIGRLFNLQILSEEYKEGAISNAFFNLLSFCDSFCPSSRWLF